MRGTAVVTGGAGDIGLALCRRFLSDGFAVAIIDRDEAALERASQALLGTGARLLPVQADVTDLPAVQEAVARAEASLGEVEVLVNNAGGVRSPTLATTGEPEWLADVELNLNGAWRCVHAVQSGMIRRRRGAIVNIASVNASGIYGYPAYSAAKAGLVQLTRFLAVELGKYGIRANAIAPGSVRTQAWNERAARDPEILERVKRWYPLGDVCLPEDVAGVASFLVGPEARMITGVVLPVDGGLSAGSGTMAREFCGAEI